MAGGCSGGAEDSAPASVGSLPFAPGELGEPISLIESPGGHGSVAVVDGHLMVIDSSDSGGSPDDGGIEFWDLSDPRAPRRVARHESEETHRLREPHGFGFASMDERTLLAAQTLEGLQIWDLTRVPEIELLADLDLPGIEGGNYAGNWWVSWQAPYIYVAGRNAGLYIVDATDPGAPVLANQLPTGELGGLGPAIVQPVGNLLVLTSNPAGGILTMDASDPLHPVPIQLLQGPRGYSHTFHAGLLLEPGGQGDEEALHIFRIGHDGAITAEPSVGTELGDGGYGAIQDGVFHAGFSDHALRFDLTTRTLIGAATTGVDGADEDFAVPLGNLTFVGNDHEGRSALVPHAAQPDRAGPAVEWVHPADGAEGLALTTRVGLSMGDQVDPASIGGGALRLRDANGLLVPTYASVQGSALHLAPREPLAPSSVYTVEVVGVRDPVGNIGPSFTSTFTTGPTPQPGSGPPVLELESLGAALVGEEILFDVDLLGGATPTSYSWDFGDGTPATAPSPFPAAGHTYTAPGRFTATLTAQSADGPGAALAVQIVHRPLDAVPPRSSSSIAEGDTLLYIANHDNDTVTAIQGGSSARAFEVSVSGRPTAVGVDPANRVWVTCRDEDRVAVLDGADGSPLASIELDHGDAPTSLVFPPGDDEALVALEGSGRVIRLALDGTVAASVDVGPRPRGLAVSGDGARILVSRFVTTGGAAEVTELDGATLAVTRAAGLADDPGPDTEASGRGRPNYLASVVLSPDGQAAFVAGKKDNLARGALRDGQALDFQSTVRAMVARIRLADGVEEFPARVDLNDRALPQSILASPRGDLLFVAAMGNDVVDVIDPWRGELVAELAVGAAPRGLAMNRLQSKLYVHDTLDRTVSVYDVRELLNARSSVAPLIARPQLVASEALPLAVHRGKRVFYAASDLRMARDGYYSCAVCHLEGGGDGAVWDFAQLGEGLRNTIPLWGRAGTAHGLMHWTANFDEVQDFEGPIRTLGGGTGFLDAADFAATADPLGAAKAGLSAELDDLSAYVSSLIEVPRSPFRNADGSRTAVGLRGEAVFQAQGCATCHAGAEFTDGLRHDVGTLLASSGQGSGAPLAGVGIETPTLRGVWASAPYLHDGRLATLEDVLLLPSHGQALSSADRADLAAFLRELE